MLAIHGTGTGKTFSSILAFEKEKEKGKARRALVLTPASLRANYLNEGINRFTNSGGQILEQPTSLPEGVDYAVVSYAAFRRNPEAWLQAVQPDTLITDEVQRALNENTATHKALMYARERVPNFMGLTASSSSNSPADIVPLLQLATAGEHPIKSRRQFNKRFVKTRKTRERGIFGGTVKRKDLVNLKELKRSIGPVVHYVEDLDASEKPVKDVETVPVEMSKDQVQVYHMAMKGVDPQIVAKIERGEPVSDSEAMRIFTRLLRARQVSNSLHMAGRATAAEAAEQTPKIKRVLDDATQHIKSVGDAQVIMYTNFWNGGVDVLSAGLKARGIPFGVFAGKGQKGVTEESRQQAVEDFKSGKNRVLVITSAGSEGLNLPNTTMVQVVDGHYNPQRTRQAEDRGVRAGGLAHRPQAERRVQVRRYVSTLPKTFWQKITFRPPTRSVGQWVYSTANQKERLNRELQGVLQESSEHYERRRNSPIYRLLRRNP